MLRILRLYAPILIAASMAALGLGMVHADGFRPIGATLGANTFVGNQGVTGAITASGLVIGSAFSGDFVGGNIVFGGGGARSRIASPVDGQIRMTNNVVSADSFLETSSHSIQKVTASASGPGVGLVKLEVVAGTNVGTCKLQVYAGTSATPTTILDNIGSGC